MKFAISRSSRWIRTSQTCVRRPTCSGSAIAVSTSPSTAAAKTLVFISTVVKFVSGGRWRNVPHAATVSANAVHAPPWTKPPGCR